MSFWGSGQMVNLAEHPIIARDINVCAASQPQDRREVRAKCPMNAREITSCSASQPWDHRKVRAKVATMPDRRNICLNQH